MSLLRDQTTNLADEDEYVKLMYYSQYGQGKTSALAGLSRLGKVLYLDAESGLKPTALRKRGVVIENLIKFPKDDTPLTYELVDELYWELKAKIPASLVGCCLDSSTDFQKRIMEGVMESEVRKAAKKKIERDPFLAYEGDWGKGNEQMRRIIRRFRDLPLHFGVSALERRDLDPDGEVTYGPALTPGVQSDAGGYVDLVCHVTLEELGGEVISTGTFRKTGKYQGKDRFDIMPKKLVDPSFDRVIAYVKGELTAETDPRQQWAKEVYRKEKEKAAA